MVLFILPFQNELYSQYSNTIFNIVVRFNVQFDRWADIVARYLSSATEVIVKPTVWKEGRIMGRSRVCWQYNFPYDLFTSLWSCTA